MKKARDRRWLKYRCAPVIGLLKYASPSLLPAAIESPFRLTGRVKRSGGQIHLPGRKW